VASGERSLKRAVKTLVSTKTVPVTAQAPPRTSPFLLGQVGDVEVLVRVKWQHVSHQLLERQWIPKQRVRLFDQVVVGGAEEFHPAGQVILSVMPSAELERLRRLLDDARAAAQEVGDETRSEPAGTGYFADAGASGIAKAIETVAAHEGEVTLFVGAGVSMEAELPSWSVLVRRLLLGAKRDEDEDAITQWADQVLREGPLAAASVAASLYGDELAFRRALRDALYAGEPSRYAPGALAGQIAWLKRQMGSRLAIMTVNYDGLLEQALAAHGLDPVSFVRARGEPAGRAAVWHLHGRLIRASSGWQAQGNLVLSEGSYVRSTAGDFPQTLVAERLRESLCVFVGLSMTDPNFIRWLYNSAGAPGGPRFVIFVRQASPVADPRVRRLLEESATARWASYKVVPAWANYYGEVAQVVHEIGLRCNGSQPLDFRERARRRLANGRGRLSPASPRAFADAQNEGSRWLRKRLDDVRGICRAANVHLADHNLGLGLWAVDHDNGQIMNWVGSDRAYQDPAAQVSNPLHVGSRWVAAAAIASGVSIEGDPRVYASRWRYVRAIPIIAEQREERSIVGALTLTSTTPLEQCALAQATAPPGLLSEIDSFVAKEAADFFLN
jgi:SIR2-like domain